MTKAGENLAAWSLTEDADRACDAALNVLDATVMLESSFFYPLCVFSATLVLWAYLKLSPHRSIVQKLEQNEKLQLFLEARDMAQAGLPVHVLRRGNALLAKGKAWSIGSAFALILHKQSIIEDV